MKVVDMHCDTIAEIYKDHKKGGRQSILENQMMLDPCRIQRAFPCPVCQSGTGQGKAL